MTAGDSLMKSIINSVFWVTTVANKFYVIFHILGLAGILFLFSLAGGWVFRMVEAPIEDKTIQNILRHRSGVISQLRAKILGGESPTDVRLYVQDYEVVYITAITNGTIVENGKSDPVWTLKGAIYFCVTTYTLVGFGNLAPRTSLGRLIAIFYAGISIPVAGLVMGEIGEFIERINKYCYSSIAGVCGDAPGKRKGRQFQTPGNQSFNNCLVTCGSDNNSDNSSDNSSVKGSGSDSDVEFPDTGGIDMLEEMDLADPEEQKEAVTGVSLHRQHSYEYFYRIFEDLNAGIALGDERDITNDRRNREANKGMVCDQTKGDGETMVSNDNTFTRPSAEDIGIVSNLSHSSDGFINAERVETRSDAISEDTAFKREALDVSSSAMHGNPDFPLYLCWSGKGLRLIGHEDKYRHRRITSEHRSTSLDRQSQTQGTALQRRKKFPPSDQESVVSLSSGKSHSEQINEVDVSLKQSPLSSDELVENLPRRQLSISHQEHPCLTNHQDAPLMHRPGRKQRWPVRQTKIHENRADTTKTKDTNILPPPGVSLILLASPFRFMFIGNVIRKLLHKLQQILRESEQSFGEPLKTDREIKKTAVNRNSVDTQMIERLQEFRKVWRSMSENSFESNQIKSSSGLNEEAARCDVDKNDCFQRCSNLHNPSCIKQQATSMCFRIDPHYNHEIVNKVSPNDDNSNTYIFKTDGNMYLDVNSNNKDSNDNKKKADSSSKGKSSSAKGKSSSKAKTSSKGKSSTEKGKASSGKGKDKGKASPGKGKKETSGKGKKAKKGASKSKTDSSAKGKSSKSSQKATTTGTSTSGKTTLEGDSTSTKSTKKKAETTDLELEEEEAVEDESPPMMMVIFVTCVYIIGGAVVLAMFSDNMNMLDAVWFLYISMVTIGYGDVVPIDQYVFVAALPYIFIGLSLMTGVLNEVTLYFTNNMTKARSIAQEVHQIIMATKAVNRAKKQKYRARARWDFVRRTVWKKNLPQHLVDEARWYKNQIFTKEREIIRRAFQIYFFRPPCEEPKRYSAEDVASVVSQDLSRARSSLQEREILAGIQKNAYYKMMEELMLKSLTWWQRFRRWVVRKFYQARFLVTGDPVPPMPPPRVIRTMREGLTLFNPFQKV